MVDVTGMIYVADTGNSRVLQIDPTGLVQAITDVAGDRANCSASRQPFRSTQSETCSSPTRRTTGSCS